MPLGACYRRDARTPRLFASDEATDVEPPRGADGAGANTPGATGGGVASPPTRKPSALEVTTQALADQTRLLGAAEADAEGARIRVVGELDPKILLALVSGRACADVGLACETATDVRLRWGQNTSVDASV